MSKHQIDTWTAHELIRFLEKHDLSVGVGDDGWWRVYHIDCDDIWGMSETLWIALANAIENAEVQDR